MSYLIQHLSVSLNTSFVNIPHSVQEKRPTWRHFRLHFLCHFRSPKCLLRIQPLRGGWGWNSKYLGGRIEEKSRWKRPRLMYDLFERIYVMIFAFSSGIFMCLQIYDCLVPLLSKT